MSSSGVICTHPMNQAIVTQAWKHLLIPKIFVQHVHIQNYYPVFCRNSLDILSSSLAFSDMNVLVPDSINRCLTQDICDPGAVCQS